MPIFGTPGYAMGAADEKLVAAAANAPVTSAQAQRGRAELAKMRRSLVAWLKFRTLNDQVASGVSVKKPILRTPGMVPMPPQALALRLRKQRVEDEQELASQLYQLLSEVFDASSLPDPDVKKNPSAAVQLAKIAIAGKLPGEASTSSDVAGPIWMWPVVVVVGVIAFVIMTAIRSSADVAKEKERLECIKAGACTDTGFWLKIGAIAVVGWLAWDKLGLREKLRGGG